MFVFLLVVALAASCSAFQLKSAPRVASSLKMGLLDQSMAVAELFAR
jgi:hypothetical protein